jgi:sialate O-acetylesterase
MKSIIQCFAVLVALTAPMFANVTLAPLFRDGAVLQREQPLPVWGRAVPGEAVHVRFHAQSAEATAGANGTWRVTLAPEPASAEPAELVVTATNTLRVRDVLVGDVWLCSGQSNMEFRVAQANNAEREIAAANFPLLRQFKVPHLVAEQPAADCPGEWKACSPATAGEFTAVGFFFARDLYQRFGVPIGLVNSSWGGTQIEEWIGEAALATDPAAKAINARWQKVLGDYPELMAAYPAKLAKWKADAAAAKAAGKPFARRQPAKPEGPGSRWLPSGMFNAMIAPLTPVALRGVLWYQGEANGARAAEYRTLFPAMIQQWRGAFAQPRLPFYFVQLPNFGRAVDRTDEQWPLLREAQAGALALPDTGMAVTIDIGDPANIHPKNKQEVGRRLALIARAQLFGEKIETQGPVFTGAKPEGAALRVSFSHATGLTAPGKSPTAFDVAGEDRKFVPATARIEGDAVVVTADSVAAPVAVRYAWHNAPEASLFNCAGLPAAPFRSDHW